MKNVLGVWSEVMRRKESVRMMNESVLKLNSESALVDWYTFGVDYELVRNMNTWEDVPSEYIDDDRYESIQAIFINIVYDNIVKR